MRTTEWACAGSILLALSVLFSVFVSAQEKPAAQPSAPTASIKFQLKSLPFQVETDETPKTPHAPATMAGGVAVFDYNGDGRPDIFFTNGANIQTLKKDAPKYYNRLYRNDGNGAFTDVTKQAGLEGSGYDIAVAVGDYDNDGHPDLFVAGVHGNHLYHNNGNGTFTDVTAKAGLDHSIDPENGPLWSSAAAWVDVNNDGLLDLVVANYLRWDYASEPLCGFGGSYDYCSPRFYKGQPNQLFLNKGDGTFEDVSEKWGLRKYVGKAMGIGVADYDRDGRPDLFITNDTYYNYLLHNTGEKFVDVAFETNVALIEDGEFVSGMGLDFRDYNNDGYPDIVFVALNNQTFPLFQNKKGASFEEVTGASGLRNQSMSMGGYCPGFYDFDNDGWKDLFVSRGHVQYNDMPASPVDQFNTVFQNLGSSGRWRALTAEAGFDASPAARHRGCAFGDFDGDGKEDIVVTALGRQAEIWMNRSTATGHWLDVALQGTKSNRDGIGAVVTVQTSAGTQTNHMTTSVGYASSSDGPVHFGLGADASAKSVEVRWPSGVVQTFKDVAGDRVFAVKESAAK